MTKEEEEYYETYFDLFASDGWKQFVNEITEIHDGYRIEHIKDEKDLSRIKGERAILFRTMQFEHRIKASYDLIQEKMND